MKKVIRLTESDLTKLVKRVIIEQSNNSHVELPEGLDSLSDRLKPYSKFENSQELLNSISGRLITAVQLKEWSLVEEVTSDVYNFITNDRNDSN